MLFRIVSRAIACALAVLMMSAPAAAELVRVSDSGFVSRHEAMVDASPKAVWLALTTPADWWQSEHTWSGDAANLTLTPQAGGCFCETIPEVDKPGRFTLQGSVEHMRVIQAYPEQALRLQGALGPLQSEPVIGILTIAISDVAGGTRIVWEYNVGGPMRYELPVISKMVDAVMATQLAALAQLLGPIAQTDETPGVEDAEGNPETVLEPATTPTVKPASKALPNASSAAGSFGDLTVEPEL